MYCFKCGKKLPARVVNCPDCDTPQKRRQRYRSRMILGLFIFLAGAVAGSLFDSVFFKGNAWQHSFLGAFVDRQGDETNSSASSTVDVPANVPVSIVKGLQTDSGISASPASFQADIQPVAAASAAVPVGGPAVASVQLASEALQTASAAVSEMPVSMTASDAVETASATGAPETAMAPAGEIPKTFPAGRLVFKKAEVLEKGAGSNYHGYMARDGSELVFASNRQEVDGKPAYQCFSKKNSVDATAEKVFSWPGNVWTPETTPDNHMIVFSSDSSKPEHIFLYDRRTRISMPLTTGTSKNMMPAVSPDGRWVAFVSNRKGSNHIWVIGIEGANLMQITSSKADDREPRWTADGKAIVFTRIIEPLKKSQILKVQLEPLGDPEPLVDTPHRNWLADISPDGTMVAFTRSESTDGSDNVLVLREVNTGKEEIIRPLNRAECFRPVWNADCSGFVFHSTSQQGKSLYLARFGRENN